MGICCFPEWSCRLGSRKWGLIGPFHSVSDFILQQIHSLFNRFSCKRFVTLRNKAATIRLGVTANGSFALGTAQVSRQLEAARFDFSPSFSPGRSRRSRGDLLLDAGYCCCCICWVSRMGMTRSGGCWARSTSTDQSSGIGSLRSSGGGSALASTWTAT